MALAGVRLALALLRAARVSLHGMRADHQPGERRDRGGRMTEEQIKRLLQAIGRLAMLPHGMSDATHEALGLDAQTMFDLGQIAGLANRYVPLALAYDPTPAQMLCEVIRELALLDYPVPAGAGSRIYQDPMMPFHLGKIAALAEAHRGGREDGG
jgi:hypothetical protein